MASHLRAPLRAGVTSLLRVPFRVEAVSHCRDFLKITWRDGAKSKFPNIWLRSSIRDEQFFDAGSCLYRLEKYLAFVSKDSSLLSAEYHEGNDFLKVQWPEHSTTFDLSWLRAQDTTHHDNAPQVVTWTADSILDNFFDYSRIVEDMESWMMCLRKYGVAYMRGVPPNEEGLKGVLHTIGKHIQSPPSKQSPFLKKDTSLIQTEQNHFTTKELLEHLELFAAEYSNS